MAHAHEQWIVEAFRRLSEREVATLHKLLGKVKQHTNHQLRGIAMKHYIGPTNPMHAQFDATAPTRRGIFRWAFATAWAPSR
jgi:hypothetical protein